MKQKDKKTFLLRKLYESKFDSKFHDTLAILNELETTTLSEAYNISKALHDEGLIKFIASKDSVHAEITSDGVESIEGLDEASYIPRDIFTDREKPIIAEKLDDFGKRLTKLELGQQVTYDDLMDEIEILKKLLHVLGKKDWQQVFKGKLIDAGLGQLTEQVADLMIETFKESKLLD